MKILKHLDLIGFIHRRLWPFEVTVIDYSTYGIGKHCGSYATLEAAKRVGQKMLRACIRPPFPSLSGDGTETCLTEPKFRIVDRRLSIVGYGSVESHDEVWREDPTGIKEPGCKRTTRKRALADIRKWKKELRESA